MDIGQPVIVYAFRSLVIEEYFTLLFSVRQKIGFTSVSLQ